MARWLLKTEPTDYSWDDLVRDGSVTWNGIKNPLALIHLRSVAAGDEAFIYHTGKERRVVGLARVVKGPFPDPKHDDPRLVVIDIIPAGALKNPVTLERMKADPIFSGWDLLRLSRLSFMRVPDPIWEKIIQLST